MTDAASPGDELDVDELRMQINRTAMREKGALEKIS